MLRRTNKKGLSIMIGYVLLVVIAIVMSGIVFQWVRTYVPKDVVQCSEDVSIFIEEIVYDCTNGDLDITVKNNGLFSVAGYFIHVTETIDQELATRDLSVNLSTGGRNVSGTVQFKIGENSLNPNEDDVLGFTKVGSEAYNFEGHKIEIIPIRYQDDDDGKERVASCGGASVSYELSCDEEEVCTETCEGFNRECGEWNICDVLTSCTADCDPITENCDYCPDEEYTCTNGICVPPDCPPDEPTVTCEGKICGTTYNNCGLPVGCLPGCDAQTEICSIDGTSCELLCGDGELNQGIGEQCDDGDIDDGDGCSSDCLIEDGWECEYGTQPSVCTALVGDYGCGDYCGSLEKGYEGGTCTANTGLCRSYPGDYVGRGDEVHCDNDYYCCCYPVFFDPLN
jgi:cysteine-rich repeat protein